MTESVQIPTAAACEEVGVTRLETTERSWGIEHTVTCSCGYYRHWARSKAAENDQLNHECDPEQLMTVGAVWLVYGGVVDARWTCTTDCVQAEECAHCRHAGITGLCPGVEAHTAAHHAREAARLPLADLRSGVFLLSNRLNRYEVVTTVQHHAEALYLAG